MDVVLVPVPEELVGDVEALLFQLRFQSNMPVFDEVAVGEHLLAINDDARSLLIEVAAAVVAGQPLADTELADALGINVREVFGLVTEANDVTVRLFTGNLIYPLRDESNPAATVRRLHMLSGHAHMVGEQRAVLGIPKPRVFADDPPRSSG